MSSAARRSQAVSGGPIVPLPVPAWLAPASILWTMTNVGPTATALRACGPREPLHRLGLIEIAGQALQPLRRFYPDRTTLAWHRRQVFNLSHG